jgi:hypothetical protein
MRTGIPAAIFESAVLLGNWGRENVEDLDMFLLYEAGFRILAKDLEDLGCPNRTIDKLFFDGLPGAELRQLKWFMRGFPFPRSFVDPEASKERRRAAFATFVNRRWSPRQLQNLLHHRGAVQVSQAIGVDFTCFPPKRVQGDILEEAKRVEDRWIGVERAKRQCERQAMMREAGIRKENTRKGPANIPATTPYVPVPPNTPRYQSPIADHLRQSIIHSINADLLLRQITKLSVRSAAEDIGESIPSSASLPSTSGTSPSSVSSSSGSSFSNPILVDKEEGEIREDANLSPGEM